MKYSYEHTDTFCGEPNYCWAHRGEVEASSWLSAVRKVKNELGLNGVKCKRSFYGDMIELRPYGICHVIFISWAY